ncbi:response regulator [Hungatella hathewayi]|uniref:response regulator transcription factor n=1 Tax=Hungatella hathewayi TaxID=154046 RepID=UPI000336C83B|nr:response regulator [Hungatella hathewayi]CCZ63013.1 putative uncharacterized protein [Hungatella hathewayi CAG:224]
MHTLIIVDDEVKILEGIAELFPWNNIGFTVARTFSRAAEALEYIASGAPVDVVLTDINMPDMTGLELTERLGEYSDIYVILFSGYKDYEYMRAAIRYNTFDYLLKPLNYEDLVDCFEKVKEKLETVTNEEEQEQKTYYSEIISRVDEYLEENYQRASLQEAAELVGLNFNYLSRLYKAKTGTGFAEKLNQIRMEKACELLLNPEYKSYEIAYYVGYDNPKNFARAFKAYFNISPRDYRNGKRGGGKDRGC